MARSDPTSSQDEHGSGSPMRAILADALHYWEPRRILYDLILAGVFIAWVALTWPHFSGAAPLQALVFLLVFALGANICYSAVYLADIPLQYSPIRAVWVRWRFGLWLVGMLLAVVFTNYWIADEIYPYVR